MNPTRPSILKYRAICKVGKGEGRNVNNRSQRTYVAMSCGEVARALGMTRQAVHQAERVALHKLRLGLIEAVRELNPELAERLERVEKRTT